MLEALVQHVRSELADGMCGKQEEEWRLWSRQSNAARLFRPRNMDLGHLVSQLAWGPSSWHGAFFPVSHSTRGEMQHVRHTGLMKDREMVSRWPRLFFVSQNHKQGRGTYDS